MIALILTILTISLSAQIGMNMNTPEGAVSMSVTGVPMGNPNSANVIDQIVDKLEKLEKEIHVKLNKLDKKKADGIMNDIYDLLSQLQYSEPEGAAAASASASSSSSSSSSASGTANININISGMENQPQHGTQHQDRLPSQHQNKPPRPDNKPSLKPMPDADFSSLLSKMKSESFSDDQMRVLRTAAKNFNFNCGQITRILDSFSFSEDKLEALEITYPKVTDPQNNYTILDAFTYSMDKQKAESIMN